MKYVIGILFILISLTSNTSYATEVRFGGWSHHFSNKPYNETHNALLVEHGGYVGGYFKNSYNHDTYLLGVYEYWQPLESVRFQLTGGVTYGYRDCIKMRHEFQGRDASENICPAVIAEFRFVKLPLRPSIGAMGSVAVITLGTEF